MLKSLSKTITFLVGAIAMFVGGVIFIIMSDLTFQNNSGNLIVATLLSFGAAILFFFSNNFIERPTVMYILKGLGLALSIGTIVYFHLFSETEFYLDAIEKLRRYGEEKATEYAFAKASVPVALAFSYLSAVAQASNIVLSAVLKEDADEPNVEKDQTVEMIADDAEYTRSAEKE